MKSNLVPIKLVFPEPKRKNAAEAPNFFLAMSILDDLSTIAFGDPTVNKVKIAQNVKPKKQNEFEIELAVILPDLLPNLEGNTEYCVDLSEGKLWVSNHMTAISFKDEKDNNLTAFIPRDAIEAQGSKLNEILNRESKKFLKTFVVWKGIIKGNDADTALAENVYDCIEKLMSLINEFVLRLLVIEAKEKESFGITVPFYSQINFDYSYLFIKGESETFALFRLALNVFRARLSPGNLKKFDETLEWHDDVYKLFSMAKTYISGGALDYGFLLLVITAELATSRFVTEQLKLIGVSQNKIDDMERLLTFNVMFNSHLPVLTKGYEKLDEKLADSINDARKKRNGFMHEAKLGIDKEYLGKLKDSVMRYIEYLERTRSEMKRPERA